MTLLADGQLATDILHGWQLRTPWYGYLGYAFIASTATRVAISMLRAYEYQEDGESFFKAFRAAFLNRAGPHQRPNWSSGLLGTAELLAYPILLVTGELTPIGFWVLLKTAGEWQGWKKSRADFLRFLIGNIMVFACSLAAAYCLVERVTSGSG